MIIRLHRLFSLTSLNQLRSLSEENNQKSYEEFYKKHQEFIKKYSDHIYCMPKKITPAQEKRAEMISEEVIKLSPIHLRVLIYLIQELKKKGFNYRFFTKFAEVANDEKKWTQDCWPSIHPSNLKFQKEIRQRGLIGIHGFPKKFIKKVTKGNIFSEAEDNKFFNKAGRWHKPASLNPKDWERFTFDINWENLNKMYNLRKFYLEISPPFTRDDAGKVIEMEKLQDDILYYHVKRSWFALLLWIIFTQVFIDPEKMDLPARHPMVNNFGFCDEEIMPADTSF